MSFLTVAALATQHNKEKQSELFELFERPVQEEYEEKSKACDAAAMNSKTEVAAVVKEMTLDDRKITPPSKSALQQQLKVSCVGTHFVHNCLLQCCRDCFKWCCLQPLGFNCLHICDNAATCMLCWLHAWVAEMHKYSHSDWRGQWKWCVHIQTKDCMHAITL